MINFKIALIAALIFNHTLHYITLLTHIVKYWDYLL